MDDAEIQETVESVLGKNAKVLDCEKQSCIENEQVLLINGLPVTLNNRDTLSIKKALINGEIPSCDLLNSLLIQSGILKAPVQLEASLSVKTTTVLKEEVTVSRNGQIVDEKSREEKKNDFYISESNEIWEPIKIIPKSSVQKNENEFSEQTPTGLGTSTFAVPKATATRTTNGSEPGTTTTTTTKTTTATTTNNNKKSTIKTNMSDRKSVSSSNSSYDSTNGIGHHHRRQRSETVESLDSGNASFDYVFAANAKNNLINDCDDNRKKTIVSSDESFSSLDEPDFSNDLVDKFRYLATNGYSSATKPTIFGTVATDPTLTTNKTNEEISLRKIEQKTSLSPNLSSNMKNSINQTQQNNALVYRDGNLVSGSIDALVQHMMPNDHYYPDRAYLFAFLLSCRLYIKPHDLISHVSDLCPLKKSPNLADSLIRWLADWTETFPYDFRDERIMHYVRNITQDCINVKSSLRKNVSSLLHNLLQRLTALENYEKHVANLQRQMLEDKPHMFDMSSVCTSPGTLAEQLTIIELEKLSFIGPEEFVQAFAKENPALETEFKDLKKTRNLEHYIQWFNRLSYFVASQVCKHPKKKQRVKVIEFWIEVARECFNIGNFNSLMSIIAGLNMSPVSRLKKTWHKINSAKFTILEHQMDPTGNFSCYRSTLKAAMWRSAGATDQRQRIVIPFFSLLVKDLYFLNEGCCNKLENGHINFEKFWQLAKQVTEFMAWKEVTCPFNRIEFLSQNLQAADVMNEQELSLASFQCEPPDNTSERDRLKTLKVESLQNSSLSSASSTTTTTTV